VRERSKRRCEIEIEKRHERGRLKGEREMVSKKK
jgi:hypothetical protein